MSGEKLEPLVANPPPVRLRPTSALARGAIGGSIVLVIAVLMGRPDIVLLGAPLLLWAAAALARRARRGEAESVPGPVLRASARSIPEGGRATVAVTTAPGLLTSVTLPQSSLLELTPGYGALIDDGEARFEVLAKRWGTVPIGPAHVLVTDAFGAFRAQRMLAAFQLRVVPASNVLEAPSDVPTPTGASGAHLSRRRGEGTALADVRPFRPGDRLHRINWRVTGRTRTLHTNATFTEQDTDVLVVTDTLADVHPSPTDPDAPTSLDMTVRATAAIARHYLAAGDRVGVHDLGPLIGPVRPGTGPRQVRVLEDVLARAERDPSRARPVQRMPQIRAGTLTAVCSPLLSPRTLEQIGALVVLGADVVVVDTLPPSLGCGASLAAAEDNVGRGRRGGRAWAEAWVLRRAQREQTIRELRASGVPVSPWEGPGSLAPVLNALARARTAPRRRRS